MPKNNDIFNTSISMPDYIEDDGVLIYRYHSSSRPRVEFYLNEEELPNKNNNLYIGFELEFDNTSSFLSPFRKKKIIKINNNLIKNYNYLYYMLDGSVKNGLEMISQPSTFNFYLKNKNIFENIFNNIINEGYVASNRCGLHFHINKDYFDNNYQSDLFYSKIQNLLTLCDKFWPNFVSFSNRKKINLDKWAHKFNTSPKDIVNGIVNKNKQGIYSNYFSKYTAINLNHSDTIEFRIFSSTLNIEDFYSLLEFIKNIAETVKNKNNEYIKDCNFESLIYGKFLTNYYKKHYNVKGINKYKPFDISFFEENNNLEKNDVYSIINVNSGSDEVSEIPSRLYSNGISDLAYLSSITAIPNSYTTTNAINSLVSTMTSYSASTENTVTNFSDFITNLSDNWNVNINY